MLDPTKIAIRASSQDHLDIEDVQNDLVILKDGSVCLILQTTAVNFGLLSEQEQDATIYAYAGLLNSLTFPIQIIIKSQRKDITSYLKLLKNEEDKQHNPQIQERIRSYRVFIESMVRENNVLDKKFYIVIPYSSIELGVKSASGLFNNGLPYPKSYILEKAKTSLFPKRDHLIRQFNRIGLKINQLNTRQLIELFFKTYNPESIGTQQIGNALEYTTSLVEAAMEPGVNPQSSSPKPAFNRTALPVPAAAPAPVATQPTTVLPATKPQQSQPVTPPENSPASPFPAVTPPPVVNLESLPPAPPSVQQTPVQQPPAPEIVTLPQAPPAAQPSPAIPDIAFPQNPTTLWKAEETAIPNNQNNIINPPDGQR